MILLIRRRVWLPVWLVLCTGCAAAVFLTGFHQRPVPAMAAGQGETSAGTVVIDPGHGGEDGGAVTADGAEESGINLAVSLRLEQLLRFAGISTEMTRRTDCMVCDPGLDTIRQRKVSDLHNRTSFVNSIPEAVLLSIHQNSLPSSPVTQGAQVFRNRQAEAEALAQRIQANLNEVVNTHRAKEARVIPESIYLMNHVKAPAVLVECGFLSNLEEAARLRQADYQMTLAVTIAAGYLQWAAEEGAL